MKKLLLLFTLFLLYGCDGGKTYKKVVGIDEDLYIISGEEIIENGQPSIYKLGDKLLEGRR